jgi:hypothetical protein
MRTKTLLLTAALAAAGIASSMAQAVYSVNAVGYVNLSIPHGFSIIGNPLDNKASGNKISSLLTGVSEGTAVYRFVNSQFSINNFAQDDSGNLVWDNPNDVINPGEGFFINNPSATAATVTFVGDVPTGSLDTTVKKGFNLLASKVPQSGQLDTVLKYPAGEGDAVYLFRNGKYAPASNYAQDDSGNLVWDNVPVPNVGEGFWVLAQTAKTWHRDFSVNQ